MLGILTVLLWCVAILAGMFHLDRSHPTFNVDVTSAWALWAVPVALAVYLGGELWLAVVDRQ